MWFVYMAGMLWKWICFQSWPFLWLVSWLVSAGGCNRFVERPGWGMWVPVLEVLGRIELLIYVPGTRGLSACWVHGDGNFGIGRGWYGWVSYILCVRGSLQFPVNVNIQKWEVSFFFCDVTILLWRVDRALIKASSSCFSMTLQQGRISVESVVFSAAATVWLVHSSSPYTIHPSTTCLWRHDLQTSTFDGHVYMEFVAFCNLLHSVWK